jgi:dTDP-4-dehydrorhamnose 3,5-epimerase
MKLIKTKIGGVNIIEMEHHKDNRGFFTRSYCYDELIKIGISMKIAQCNFAYNEKRGTFRGMHYQSQPFEEKKIVSCVKGLIYDVVLDIREDSETYGKWQAFILSDNLEYSLHVPKGVAHGFQTLVDNTIVHYMISTPYSKNHSCGVSYKKFNIDLPLKITNISEKDDE